MTYSHTRCVDDVIREEGFRPHAYKDSLGFLTIGHGILIDKDKGGGITEEESRFLLENRLGKIRNGLDQAIPWWRELSAGRCSALVSMAYQMGVDGLLKFRAMLAHMEAGEFGEAADEALHSLWARQTPGRAVRVSEQIRSGE